jgi:ParB/RepB/Spo0J family partition protein
MTQTGDVPAVAGGTDVALVQSVPQWQKHLDEARVALASAIELEVDPEILMPMPGQPREHFSEESINRLADGIRGVGQVYRGIIRRHPSIPGFYEIVDGERRWRAVKLVPGRKYRATLVEISDRAVQFLVAVVANFQREQHTPLELSRSIEYMHEEMGMPMDKVAEVIGFKVKWAEKMLGLRFLIPEVRKMLDPSLDKKEQLPVVAAITISEKAPDEQLALAQRVMQKVIPATKVAKVARREAVERGAPAPRTRAVTPFMRWASIQNGAAKISTDAEELATNLKDRDYIADAMSSRPNNGVGLIFTEFKKVRAKLDECERLLREALQREKGP